MVNDGWLFGARTLLAAAALVAAVVLPASRHEAGLTGRVVFSGAAPAGVPIDMSGEAYCGEAHRAAPAEKQSIVVGAERGLRNTVVYIRNAPATNAPVPTEPVILDQQRCLYVPTLIALRVGQPFVIRNSDQVLHNVHGSPKKNPVFNVGQPIAGMQAKRMFKVAEIGIGVRCDIHDWMEASVAVFDHPFFAVSDADGRFAIDGLPAGEYELVAWHPALGERTQRVRVGDGATTVSITFEK